MSWSDFLGAMGGIASNASLENQKHSQVTPPNRLPSHVTQENR